ncbi:MAG: S8 family serine peptidase [Nitrospira sp.]|nr:S8 family serine peptidase [Nitrospira sp.]
MPELTEVRLGKKTEPPILLRKSDDLIAVRTRSTRSIKAGAVRTPESGEVADGHLVFTVPEAGVEIYRVPPGAGRRSLESRKEALRAAADVRFAGGVMVDEKSREPVLYTENLFIKFVDEMDLEDCRAVIREAGLTIKKELTYATNAFFVGAPEGTGTRVFDTAASLLNRTDVEYCHPELVRPKGRRVIAVEQWHLKTTTIDGTAVSASANVEAAHQVTQGEGVVIAVIDDGVDIDHPEFSGAGKIVAPRDASLGTGDPRPKDPHPAFTEDHGTACAGVACAAGLVRASGVAPKAKLIPIRLSSALGSQQEAEAFEWAANNGADVISCSWGPEDGDWWNPNHPAHNQKVPIPASTKLAVDYATTKGRGGKGCVVLFAAGNGNESVDNDGYASYERIIAVAACNDRGKRSVYSDFGKAIWCSFPSSDRGHAPFQHPAPLTKGIFTTDRVGASGYNPGTSGAGDNRGNYTNSFGGTSSACPGAAGVAALVLSVNPELKWQEVREILKQSCDKIDPQGGNYTAEGWSRFYGYGRLNAEKAVALAKPGTQNRVLISRTFNELIPDLQMVTVSLDVNDATPIENLIVHLDLAHTYIGDLVITLMPPTGLNPAKVVLHDRTGGATQNLKRTYDMLDTQALAPLKGKGLKGTWTLDIEDAEARDEGTLRQFGLELVFGSGSRRAEAARSTGAMNRGRRAEAGRVSRMSSRRAPSRRA